MVIIIYYNNPPLDSQNAMFLGHSTRPFFPPGDAARWLSPSILAWKILPARVLGEDNFIVTNGNICIIYTYIYMHIW